MSKFPESISIRIPSSFGTLQNCIRGIYRATSKGSMIKLLQTNSLGGSKRRRSGPHRLMSPAHGAHRLQSLRIIAHCRLIDRAGTVFFAWTNLSCIRAIQLASAPASSHVHPCPTPRRRAAKPTAAPRTATSRGARPRWRRSPRAGGARASTPGSRA